MWHLLQLIRPWLRPGKVYWLWGEKWCHIYSDISLMIFTVLFEGGTTWDGKFIHISTVGLCWLYIKLFTHLWYVASSPVDSSVVTTRKSVLIMRWEVMSYLFWHITYDFYCTFWRRNDMGREIYTYFDGRAVLTLC